MDYPFQTHSDLDSSLDDPDDIIPGLSLEGPSPSEFWHELEVPSEYKVQKYEDRQTPVFSSSAAAMATPSPVPPAALSLRSDGQKQRIKHPVLPRKERYIPQYKLGEPAKPVVKPSGRYRRSIFGKLSSLSEKKRNLAKQREEKLDERAWRDYGKFFTGGKKKTKKRRKRRRTKKRNNAGSLRKTKRSKKSVGRFIPRRRTSKSRNNSLERKQMSKLKKHTIKMRTLKKLKKEFESKIHMIDDLQTTIQWDGDRNKKGHKMYSIYSSHALNLPNVSPEEARVIVGPDEPLYYVPKTKTYVGKEEIANFGVSPKKKSRSKSKRNILGLTIR